MKKTLFLHIGYHKTGTTSIQNFFGIIDWLFERKGYCILSWAFQDLHMHNLLLVFLEKEIPFSVEIASVDCSESGSSYEKYHGPTAHDLYGDLGKVIEQTECTRILLSSECFLEWVSPYDIQCYV